MSEWDEICKADERRGLWMRVERSADGLHAKVEIRSGREGGDGYVSLKVGQVITAKDLHDLEGVLTDLQWALEMARKSHDWILADFSGSAVDRCSKCGSKRWKHPTEGYSLYWHPGDGRRDAHRWDGGCK